MNTLNQQISLKNSQIRLKRFTINASELFKGAYLSERVDDNLKAVSGILDRLKLLDFTFRAAKHYGEIYSELKEKGELIGDMDILVASITLTSNEKLITKNIKHFNRIKVLEIANL